MSSTRSLQRISPTTSDAREFMRQKPTFIVVLLFISMVVPQEFGPFLSAQTTPVTPEQLDQLLAPVALYPDSLLSQITTASTNPQEILDVHTWLQQNPGLTGTALTGAAQKQGFDPAFIALVNFPDVLAMMAEHVDDYAALGQAFLSDQGAVTASIQRLRAQAYASGALRSNSQQQVEVQHPAGQTVYVIQPASPQVVYVPQYDPTLVYVRPASSVNVATALIGFGAGIAIGALLVNNQPWGWGGWGWNWGSRRAYYNHGYWSGWSNPYRPPHRFYRPRPIVWANRPGYRGNWSYRPPHYTAPNRPGNRLGPGRPGNRPPGHRPAPPPRRPSTPNRPGRPSATRPTPPNRPPRQPAGTSGRPEANRPTRPGQKPTAPARSSGRPSRPGAPNRPSRPTAPGQTKPASPNRPPGNKPSAQPERSPRSRPQPQKRPAPQARRQPEPKNQRPQQP